MDATIKIVNNVFQLLNDNKQVMFQHQNWQDVEDYADNSDINIMYGPQDLVFDVCIDLNAESYIVVDVKYNLGNDNLGYHNVYGLPSCVDSVESVECTFDVTTNITEQALVQAMENLGAKREFFL